MKNISLIKINRWLGVSGKDLQLHGFFDASEKGFESVIYSRAKVKGKIHIKIIAFKSRVAPLKVVTIPRLELGGANLIEVIMPILKENNIQCYC